VEKNLQKYNTYKNAFEQIDAAINAGFFLEAITIEESILTDRLYRFCRDNGYTRRVERATLGDELRFITSHPIEFLQSENVDYLPEAAQFWTTRNTCLHQIAKSEPDTPTLDYEELSKLAKETAIEGKSLVKKVSLWAQKNKAKVLKKVKSQ
jgi:hypothetical protein